MGEIVTYPVNPEHNMEITYECFKQCRPPVGQKSSFIYKLPK
jgi:hypothetical protein